MKVKITVGIFIFLFISILHSQEVIQQEVNPSDLLRPVKTDTPRDTMRSFIEAMNDYRKGIETNNEKLKLRINDAIRTLNLEEIPFLLREEKGKEAAIFLKEVIDRVIIIDYNKIPDEPTKRWRLKGTEIVITQVESGERAGEHLFSPDTVHRAREFYEKVKHLPYLEGSGMGAGYKEPWYERNLPDWAKKKFFVMNIWQWLGLALLILIGLVIKTLLAFLLEKIANFVSRSKTQWDDKIIQAFKGPTGYIFAIIFWFLSIKLLKLDSNIAGIFNSFLKIILSINLIWLTYKLTEVLSEYLFSLTEKTESTLDDQLVPLLTRTLKIFVVVFGVLMALQNLGINVMSLLAGLGIGGLAFALAAKDTIANFFGSLMILFDKPFQVGDWIIVGDAEGTVEEIGFRSTRIRTFYNSVISIPNSELMNAKIDNMGRRQYRRLKTFLNITYDTPPEKIEGFLEGIKNIIKANPTTRKDYFHVVFYDYGPDSLIIMLYLFFKVPDWSNELIERQNILLEIFRLAKELKIEFAFPTRTLHVETFPEKKPVKISTETNTEEIKRIVKEFGPEGKLQRARGLGIFIPPFKEL
ncbi:MAG: hypothetical protein KatS3mg129_0868 [Leptospiraceae bacterium]|nr:MAG: hypothetical protein KatS3mg129_0868 [Leptospiraceae bacterium]